MPIFIEVFECENGLDNSLLILRDTVYYYQCHTSFHGVSSGAHLPSPEQLKKTKKLSISTLNKVESLVMEGERVLPTGSVSFRGLFSHSEVC